jgi:cytochrome P450 family 628
MNLSCADPGNFPQPKEFIPERWSTKPELIKRKDAFIPFSGGAFGCAGKPLAMMELRMAVALMVRKFDIKTIGKSEVLSSY